MSSVSAAGNSSSAVSTAITNATTKELGKDEFLKLLLTELQYQDAMDPVKDKDFIAQMAQFSSLEQTTNLVEAFTKVAKQSQNNQALSLLGTAAKAVDPDTGEITEGIVASIRLTGDDPDVTIVKEDNTIAVVKMSEISEAGIVATS